MKSLIPLDTFEQQEFQQLMNRSKPGKQKIKIAYLDRLGDHQEITLVFVFTLVSPAHIGEKGWSPSYCIQMCSTDRMETDLLLCQPHETILAIYLKLLVYSYYRLDDIMNVMKPPAPKGAK